MLHEMYCSGHEEDLMQCYLVPKSRREHNCTHDEDVFIKCEPDEVCLAKGDKDGTGALDFWAGHQWSAVCGDDWTLNNTRVVCNHLGYPGAVNESMMAVNVSGSPQYNASFHCLGNEKSLSECTTAQVESCNSSVFISCLGKVRLVDGGAPNAGRLEVFRGRRWYRAQYFTSIHHPIASVVCRQLGFPTSKVLLHDKNVFGEGSLPPYPFEFWCTGDEAYLSRCQEGPAPAASSNDFDIAISCDTGKAVRPDIRLVGGSTFHGTSREGVLQIYSHGFWGTVSSNDDWTDRNTHVACTHLLGPGSRGEKLPTNTFPAVSGMILIERVDCRGTESSLLDCPYWGLGKPYPHAFAHGLHSADVALRCFPPVTDPCDVVQALAACDGSSQLCDVIDGQAVCRSKPTEGGGSTSLLAVYISVPAAVVVVLALALWWRCSRRRRHTERSNASGSNNFDDNRQLTSDMNTHGKNKNSEIPTTLGLTTYPVVDNPTFEGNSSVRL
ncbi:CD5 antigen-like [Littorina saxatilis]|uniref:CD5 antigen-like n=1 Tax=Littorina saxatilis TaxID=31220 RepID=UPI0038B4B6B7